MKKNEHYNQNSAPQLRTIERSFTYIRKAVSLCEVANYDDSTSQFTIVDYGCSQGANSVIAIKEILSNLREKYATMSPRNILVVFNDQPTNDWTALFKAIENQFIEEEGQHITTLVSGKTFYKQIMPLNSVDFAYTSTSIHWLSRIVCNISNQWAVHAQEVKQEEFQLWKQQAHDDYKLFLQNRSKEIKKGGVLLCVGPAYVEGLRNVHLHQNLYNSVMAILSSEEVLTFNSNTYLRTLNELTDKNTLKETNFEVIAADVIENDQLLFYVDFKDGKITLDEFGRKFTGFVRSWSEASVINALDSKRNKEDKAKVIEEVYNELERQVKSIESLKLMEMNRTNTHFVVLKKI